MIALVGCQLGGDATRVVALEMVVLEVLAEDTSEVGLTQGDDVVQAVLANGAHQPLGVRVEIRTPGRPGGRTSYDRTMSFLRSERCLRWSGTPGGLRGVAEAIHSGVREGVIAELERGRAAHFVSHGVASPPGPIRLLLEDRRRRTPGVRYRAVLRREKDVLTLTVAGRWFRAPPAGLLAALNGAVRELPSAKVEGPWR